MILIMAESHYTKGGKDVKVIPEGGDFGDPVERRGRGLAWSEGRKCRRLKRVIECGPPQDLSRFPLKMIFCYPNVRGSTPEKAFNFNTGSRGLGNIRYGNMTQISALEKGGFNLQSYRFSKSRGNLSAPPYLDCGMSHFKVADVS